MNLTYKVLKEQFNAFFSVIIYFQLTIIYSYLYYSLHSIYF